MSKPSFYISFGLVNDWLRFAEAKNGALIAFCSACVFGLLKFPSDWITVTPGFKAGLAVAVVFLFIAIIVCMWSFSPQTNRLEIMFWQANEDCNETDNLIFFGDICKYSADELFDSLCERYCMPTEYSPQQRQYILDLTNQVVVNSKITMRKFRLFQKALGYVLWSFPAFLLSWLLATVTLYIFSIYF